MDIIIAVLLFGVAAMGVLLAFAICKMQRLWKDMICICNPEHKGPCKEQVSCTTLQAINADFLERRNEFWLILGQITGIIVIIILLTVLLLMDKIKSEAALPIIAGLGSFGIGKGIATFKNRIAPPVNPDDSGQTPNPQTAEAAHK